MQDSLKSAFRRLTTSSEHQGSLEPNRAQLSAAESLLAGKRVLLRSHASSGKSLAAWFPWFFNRLQPSDFPANMIHVLPGGVACEDLLQRLRDLAKPQSLNVNLHSEGEGFDPFLLSDAAITSVEQLLSVALHRPLGMHPNLSNIDAGALLGAYLIFDEFPALTAPNMLTVWLGLLRRYLPFTPCIFATAVWPKKLCKRVAEALDAEFIDAGMVAAGGVRQWRRVPGMGAEAILRRQRGKTIVVCNSVRGAQTLYRACMRALAGSNLQSQLLLLHQYQLFSDRKVIEERVSEIFGENRDGQGLLITTSAIEVAAHISADTMITDIAPAEDLLRRAGRCARMPGQHGQVIVTRLQDQPAHELPNEPISDHLLNTLADGAPKTFGEELMALDASWAAVQPHDQPAPPSDEEIDEAARRAMGGDAKLLSRLFTRVGTCLHRVPETVQDPFELERFSIAVPSLERGWRQWNASGCAGEWFALIPRWPERGQSMPSWHPVTNSCEFHADARLLVLNSEAVGYDPVIGLELAPGASYQSRRIPAQHTTWSPFDQHVQSFEEHAARTLAAFEHLAPGYRYILRHLGERWRMSLVELEQWLRLMIRWHDAGKLTADWQRAAVRWQSDVARRPWQEGMIARVDYRSRRDGAFPCPDHAPATGKALLRALTVLLGSHEDLLHGTLTALCRHHGAPASHPVDLTPHPEAWSVLMAMAAGEVDDRQLKRLDRAGWTLTPRGMPEIIAGPPENPDAWMAYSLLARTIRLADREIALEEVFA